jgi:translation initiation factor 4E
MSSEESTKNIDDSNNSEYLNQNTIDQNSSHNNEREQSLKNNCIVNTADTMPKLENLTLKSSAESEIGSFNSRFSPADGKSCLINSNDDGFAIENQNFVPIKNYIQEHIRKTYKGEKSSESLVRPLPELKPKHSLQDSWSFWFFKMNKTREWKNNIHLLGTVNTVEDFWSVYSHLKPVELLSDGCDYMVFKKGILPMWEDEKNKNGGRLLMNVEKTNCLSYLNVLWTNSLLSLIGSSYDNEADSVNGLVVNIRHKINKLALWTNNFHDEVLQAKISKRFSRDLGISEICLIYEKHAKFLEKIN